MINNATKITEPSPIESIRAIVGKEFAALNQLIKQKLYTEVPLVEDMSHYIVDSGGKRIRPMLALLAAKAMGFTGDKHILLAAIIEFIHTATLLHDDIVDNAEQRRGHTTANVLWSNSSAVLVGDFIYSRAFQMMVELSSLKVMEIFSYTTNKISEGEVLQLMNCGNTEITREAYFTTIYYKTAKLFEATTCLTALIYNADEKSVQAMTEFGKQFGMAYQLTDDALDYAGNSTQTGKNIGQDLSEGKLTLPLIYALEQGNQTQKASIKQAITEKGHSNLEAIIETIRATDAIAYTQQQAQLAVNQACHALSALPASPARDAMHDLSQLLLQRDA